MNPSKRRSRRSPLTELDGRAPFLQHLEELRSRLIHSLIAVAAGFAVSYWKVKELFAFLALPLEGSLDEDSAIVMIKMTEGFLTYLKLAFYAGLFLASPYVIYQVWSFVSPGLYRREKRTLVPIVFVSSILFVVGVAFAYSIVLPIGIKYLLEFVGNDIRANLSMSSYVSFTCLFLILFGIVFQLPLVLLTLNRLGFVRASSLGRNRKYVLLGSFLVGAFLTPPDIISQSLMAVPVLLLYEVSIWLVHISEAMRKKEKGETAPPDPGQDDAPPPGPAG
jgi:sec-independent protein translocase protein TatC